MVYVSEMHETKAKQPRKPKLQSTARKTHKNKHASHQQQPKQGREANGRKPTKLRREEQQGETSTKHANVQESSNSSWEGSGVEKKGFGEEGAEVEGLEVKRRWDFYRKGKQEGARVPRLTTANPANPHSHPTATVGTQGRPPGTRARGQDLRNVEKT